MTTPTRPVRRAVAVLATLVMASLLPLAGMTAADAARPTLTVSDLRPIAGEKVTVAADLPGSFARRLQLQTKVKGRWRTVATKRSDRAVRARFAHRVRSGSATPLRVVAPQTRHRGATLPRRTSRVLTVRPRTQSVRLDLPATARAGTHARATVVASPARSGRIVRVQRLDGGTWRNEAAGRQNASGRAVLTLRADQSATYRAVAVARAGAPQAASRRETLAVLPSDATPLEPEDVDPAPADPTDTPAPPDPTADPTDTPAPPDPTDDPVADEPLGECDLPEGGTVRWGRGAGGTPDRGVGTVRITTEDGAAVTSRTTYSRATMTVVDPDGTSRDLPARLRVRGNSTSWATMKLPYKVKLDARSSVLSMPTSKEWVLLANFYDRSMLRNDAAFEAARRLGMDWVPRMRPVEVWMNDTYAGLYQLGEGIELESARVDLEDGAALLEADSGEDTDPSFVTRQGLQVFVKKLDDADDPVVRTAAAYVRRAEDVLYSADFADPDHGYRACLDVESFVDAYLLSELTKNLDSNFRNSVWMVAGADGRIAMGPPWDFDLGMGNRTDCSIDQPTGWFTASNCWWTQLSGPEGTWYHRLLADPGFVDQVRARWAQVRSPLATLPDHVDASASDVAEAAERTFQPRSEGGAGIPLGASILEPTDLHVFHGSWAAESAHLSHWLRTRVAWLDEQWG